MTLVEIQAWIKSAKEVDCLLDQYDDRGNRETEFVYEKDGLFYRIGFFNGHPYEHHTAIGTIVRGDYEDPTPVRKAAWMEYTYKWVE